MTVFSETCPTHRKRLQPRPGVSVSGRLPTQDELYCPDCAAKADATRKIESAKISRAIGAHR